MDIGRMLLLMLHKGLIIVFGLREDGLQAVKLYLGRGRPRGSGSCQKGEKDGGAFRAWKAATCMPGTRSAHQGVRFGRGARPACIPFPCGKAAGRTSPSTGSIARPPGSGAHRTVKGTGEDAG